MNQQQIQTLKRMINQNSYTWNKSSVDAMGELVQELMQDLPLEWEVTANNEKGNLYYARTKTWDRKKPHVLLSGHLDTVFEENWDMHIDGDKFYAPGGMDMKAGLLVIIETLKTLQNQGNLRNISILFSPDEEDGMIHLEKQAQYYKQADYALVFEEGTWDRRAVQAHERALVTKRKALSFYDVDVTGPGGHNAMMKHKDQRHSAVHEMARVVQKLEELTDCDQGTLVNVGVVSGGMAANAIAEHAYLRVDIRYGSRSELKRVKQALADDVFVSSDPAIEISSRETLYYPSMEPNKQSRELATKIIDLGKSIGLDIQEQFRSAGSEANWISHFHPDCVVLDGFGVIGDGDHSSQEYFLMSTFKKSVELATETITLVMKN